MNERTDKVQYRTDVLDELKDSYTNIGDSGLDYNVDGCGCMSCLCHRSAWTVVLSPAGIAAGMAAFAADAVL